MAALTASRPTITLPDWTTPRVSFEENSGDKGDTMASKPSGTQSQSASRSEPYEATQNRGRRDRPCDACRRRKTRCVMEEGGRNCSLCKMQGQTCTFVENPLPRKRRSISGAPDAEDVKRRQVTVKGSIASLKQGSASQSSSQEVGQQTVGTRGPDLERSSTPQTASLLMQRGVRYVGLTTEIEAGLSDLCQLPNPPEFDVYGGSLQRFGDSDTFLVPPEHVSRSSDASGRYVQAIEAAVGPSGAMLVDIYFQKVHPAFPILDEQDFMNHYRRSPYEIASPLLAAVYMLALRWWPLDDRWKSTPEGNWALLPGMALSSLEIALRQPDLSTLQAGLLLLQRQDEGSWLLTSQLVAVGQDLGLHLDCSDWDLPSWERGLRKRLAWALFMQDKWGALIHGRPSHLLGANWAVRPLMESDFEDDPCPTNNETPMSSMETTRLHFSSMVSLAMILSEILEAFYSLQAVHEIAKAGTNGTRVILDRAKPIQITLREWYARLPGCIRMDNTTGQRLSCIGRCIHTPFQAGCIALIEFTRIASPGSLHLAYFATEITLHRRIVRSLNTSTTDSYLVHICRTAAKTRLISAMDFVNRLKVEHLQSFWHSASKTNFALIGTFGSLLWATSLSKQEAEFYQLRLGEYRWTLTVSRKWASFIGFAVGTLDRSRQILEQMEEKPLIPPPPINNNNTIDLVSSSSSSGSGSSSTKREAHKRSSSSLGQWSSSMMMPESFDKFRASVSSSTMEPPSGLASPSSLSVSPDRSPSVISLTPTTGWTRHGGSPAQSIGGQVEDDEDMDQDRDRMED
ncbi:MAG: Fungal specific transcription factor [Peltula sp. TS41687]|nr:MAG: Fungal specific transcription factor [Peltula sp. TS41687]